ncbi:hypothetical protein [Bradyrhizobium genosp. SA-3]|uniref:hypothetical protein n=1 Tax=Bradyrhizobium genosp. SA-3 TaxID=508868 RepID=UPI0013EE9126|nr:hypothetical protein [Bradyrhizobium genosp. SA-3]
MDGMGKRCEVNRLGKMMVCDPRDGRRKPSGLPGYDHVSQGKIRDPGGGAHRQRDNLGLAIELRVQFGLPRRVEPQRQRKGELPGEGAMRRDQECCDPRLLARWNAAVDIERTEEAAHGSARLIGMARRWS